MPRSGEITSDNSLRLSTQRHIVHVVDAVEKSQGIRLVEVVSLDQAQTSELPANSHKLPAYRVLRPT